MLLSFAFHRVMGFFLIQAELGGVCQSVRHKNLRFSSEAYYQEKYKHSSIRRQVTSVKFAR